MGQNAAQFRKGLFFTLGFLAAVLVTALLIYAHAVFLLIFGSVLLAVVLTWLANELRARVHLPYRLAVVLVAALLVGVLGGIGYLSGPRIADQLDKLGERLPESIQSVRTTLSSYSWGRYMLSLMQSRPGPGLEDLLGRTASIFTFSMSLLITVLVVAVLTLYLSVSAGAYYESAFLLLPEGRQKRAREVADALARALRWWFVGRLTSMVVVGVMTGVGLHLLGVPLALTLGFLAFLLSFVPFIGAVVSFFPAAAVGLLSGWITVLYIAALYTGVHAVEAYLLTPLLQKRVVSLPPVLLIGAQVLMVFLAGVPGVLLATPLMVVVIVLVQMLYMHDVLGRPAHILGDTHR